MIFSYISVYQLVHCLVNFCLFLHYPQWQSIYFTSGLFHLRINNFRNIAHFLKRMLKVVDNAVFWQNVLLHFENDPLSPSF